MAKPDGKERGRCDPTAAEQGVVVVADDIAEAVAAAAI